MDISTLSNEQLWNSTTECVRSEREKSVDLLVHLTEVQKRLLFAEYGYSSLWKALTELHGYDGGSAQRRVDVVHMLRDRPELEARLRSGELNITTLSAVRVCISNNEMTEQQKDDLLKSVENKSTREAEFEIAKVAPKPLPRDKEKPLDATHTLGTYVLDAETIALVQQLKAELSHVDPKMSMNNLIKYAAKIALEKVSKTRQPKRERKDPPPAPMVGPLSAAQKRDVFIRDGNKCRECGSTHQLEIDHIIPRACGGTNQPENLRVLCKTHNLMHARKWYGAEKMKQYMRH